MLAFVFVPTPQNCVRRCLVLFSSPTTAKLLSFGNVWDISPRDEWYDSEEECRQAIAERTGLPESSIPLYDPNRPEVDHD